MWIVMSEAYQTQERPPANGGSPPTHERARQNGAIRRLGIDTLLECPENRKLYRPVDRNAPDVQALAKSIGKYGVREPLVITEDRVVLSGHRRLTAAKMAGVKRIPCRFEHIRYEDSTSDEIVKRLREYNRQRVKSVDEILREEVVSTDPGAAYERLLRHRLKKSDMSDFSSATIDLAKKTGRKGISALKFEMLDAACRVIEALREFWPASVRQVHYGLLNDPPLRNAKRANSRYANDRASYGDLCDLLTRARLVGSVPWQSVRDDTRPTTSWQCWANPQDFIREQLADLFQDFRRDLQRSQPNHIEIVGEKLTIKTIVERVAGRYGVPVTIGRGYCSITPRRDMAQRFRRSGKQKLILLIVSDFDPDGESIAESFSRSMRDDFDIDDDDLHPVKVALTGEQASEMNLKPQMQAKRGSSQYTKFTSEHGKDVFELEALEPETLQQLLAEAIESVLDIDAFNAEVDAEKADATIIDEASQRARIALRGVSGDASS